MTTKKKDTSAARSFPLLYRAQLIRAFIKRSKTMTRRVMKPQPEWKTGAWYWHSRKYDNGDGVRYFHSTSLEGVRAAWSRANPFGKPGDTMYAREATWRDERDERVVVYDATPEIARYDHVHATSNGLVYCTYQETGTWRLTRTDALKSVATNEHWRLTPSIHMLRWASRISATLVSVEPQRLLDISIADAIAEGIPQTAAEALELGMLDVEPHEWDNCTSAENFVRMVRSINELGDDDNPFVWALRFADVKVEMPEHDYPFKTTAERLHATR
jgi:hypothetical protein